MRGGQPSKRRVIKRVRDALARTEAQVDVNLVFVCPVTWESMQRVEGHDETVRHCSSCECRVYDLTQTRKADVLTLIRRSGGNLCGQVARRSDGRVVFGTCTQDEGATLSRGQLVIEPR